MAINYTGNPSGGPHLGPSPAPGPGVAPIVSIPADTDPNNSATMFQQQLETLADFDAWTAEQALAAVFGDGNDGTATLDGTNTVTWATKVGSVYTMTRDAQLAQLTVTGASVVLKTAGYRLFCKGTLATVGGASINNDGSAGAITTAGNGAPAGTLLGGANGGAGGAFGGTTSGTAGSSITNSGGGAGGGGGSPPASPSPGAGGNVTTTATTLGGIRSLSPFAPGFILGISGGVATWTALTGGAGGGGGACTGSSSGGGGGGGGGVMDVRARQLNLATAGDIHCNGGNGGAALAGGVGGGGGGGGGGLIYLIYGSAVLGSGSLGAATNCAGGAGGLGAGGGGTGTNGSNGTLVNHYCG